METNVLPVPVNEALREHPAASLPEISYRKALCSHFTLDQVTYTVSNCPISVFRRFVGECVRTSSTSSTWKPFHQESLLHMLTQDGSDVARWYVLNTLLEHKVIVPLETEERPATLLRRGN